jgi:hypothetical protein
MPDYSDNLMRGPLVRMTVGNWIDCQLGILNSVNFKIPQDSPWEIALDEPEGGKKQLILPHIVEVTLGFTPIGSETRGTNLISKKSEFTSHIAQNNTGDIGFQYIGSKSSLIIDPPTLTQNPNNSPVTKIAAPPPPNIRASTPQAPQQSQTSLITPQVQSLNNSVSQNTFNSLVRPSGNTSLQPQVPPNPTTNDPQSEYIINEGIAGSGNFTNFNY